MLYLTTALAALSLTLTVNHDFELWKKEHGKSYKNVQEEAEALKAYEENDAIIRAHNAKNLSYTLGHNEWSAMTWEKFQNTVMGELYLNVPPKNTQRVHIKLKEAKIADAVDWVTAGAVTPVKNQGHCGRCPPPRPRRAPPPCPSSARLLSAPHSHAPAVAPAAAGRSPRRARSRARTRSRRARSSPSPRRSSSSATRPRTTAAMAASWTTPSSSSRPTA